MSSPFAGVDLVGMGRTAFTRSSGRSTLALTVEAVREALADAGLDVADVDGIINYNTGDSASSQRVAHGLGIEDLGWAVDVQGGGNVVAQVVSLAAFAVLTRQWA